VCGTGGPAVSGVCPVVCLPRRLARLAACAWRRVTRPGPGLVACPGLARPGVAACLCSVRRCYPRAAVLRVAVLRSHCPGCCCPGSGSTARRSVTPSQGRALGPPGRRNGGAGTRPPELGHRDWPAGPTCPDGPADLLSSGANPRRAAADSPATSGILPRRPVPRTWFPAGARGRIVSVVHVVCPLGSLPGVPPAGPGLRAASPGRRPGGAGHGPRGQPGWASRAPGGPSGGPRMGLRPAPGWLPAGTPGGLRPAPGWASGRYPGAALRPYPGRPSARTPGGPPAVPRSARPSCPAAGSGLFACAAGFLPFPGGGFMGRGRSPATRPRCRLPPA